MHKSRNYHESKLKNKLCVNLKKKHIYIYIYIHAYIKFTKIHTKIFFYNFACAFFRASLAAANDTAEETTSPSNISLLPAGKPS